MTTATKTRRPVSEHAAAAKAIRRDLKAAFPTVAFRVRSSSFAGGNAVDIDWVDGPTTRQVDRIVAAYEYGSFDGMRDLYEVTNSRDDVPQVKYVQTQRRFSAATKRAGIEHLNAIYGWTLDAEPVPGYPEEVRVRPETDEPIPHGSGWKSSELYRLLQAKPLVCAVCGCAAEVPDVYCGECGTILARTED